MIEIRRMDISHLDEVFEIERHSFVTPWTRSALEQEIVSNTMAIYIVALENGAVVGYAGMWHIVNEGHITNIAVQENCRHRGIGTMIVKELVRVAQELEMIGITLEVRINNLKAQRLYTNLGFKPEGFRKNYYEDTKEDAVIMWKKFNIEG